MMRTCFLQDDKGHFRIPDKKDTTSQKKKKNKKKTTSESTHEQDSPIPQELRLPPPVEDPIRDPTDTFIPPEPRPVDDPNHDTPIPDKKENTPPKKKKSKRKKKTQSTHEQDSPIAPELKLPTPVQDPICDPTDTSIPPEPRPVDNENRDPNNDVVRDPNCEYEDIKHLLIPDHGPVSIIRKKDGSVRYVLSRADDPPHIPIPPPSDLESNKYVVVIHKQNGSIRYILRRPDDPPDIPIPPPSDLESNEHLVIHKKNGSIRYQLDRAGSLAIDNEKKSVKDLEKKHKNMKKQIAPLEKQLEKLNNEKAHIESCQNFFESDETGFMNTFQPPDPPAAPEESERESPPPLDPPRPDSTLNLWQHLGKTLLDALPKDNEWSRSHSGRRRSPHRSTTTSSTNVSSDDLPQPFGLFCRSSHPREYQNQRRSPSPPPRPTFHSDSPHSGSGRGQHCLCYDCMHDRGHV